MVQVEGGIVSFSQCTMFSLDTVDSPAGNKNITECVYGWEFDTSTVSSSIVIDVSFKKSYIRLHHHLIDTDHLD